MSNIVLNTPELLDNILSFIPCHNCLLVNTTFFSIAIEHIWRRPHLQLDRIFPGVRPFYHSIPLEGFIFSGVHYFQQIGSLKLDNLHTLHIINRGPKLPKIEAPIRKVILTNNYQTYTRADRYSTTALLEQIAKLDIQELEVDIALLFTRKWPFKIIGEVHELDELAEDKDKYGTHLARIKAAEKKRLELLERSAEVVLADSLVTRSMAS